ncbi:MAG: histidine kinase, partial [Bacteroidales bacterium]|nr:histidine kinase [Bacteroidales bacterium]
MKQKIIGRLPSTFVCLLLSFILIVFGNKCFAQNFLMIDYYNVDSLHLILPGQQAEERVNTLNRLAVSLYFEEIELAEQYADEALSLAKQLHYQEGIADALRNLSEMYVYLGNYTDGLNNGFEALRIYEKLDKKNAVANLYTDIANVHYLAGNLEKAIEYGHIASDKFREPLEGGTTVGSFRDTINLRMTLGVTYRSLGMFDKSLEIFLEHLKVGKRNNFGDTEIMLHTFLVGSQYYFIGEADSTKAYLEKALAYPDVNPSVQALKYRPLTYLGDLFYSAGETDSAIFYKQKAFDWYNKNGFLYWAMSVSNQLGSIYTQNSELNTAEKYYLQSEMLFNEALIRNSWYRYDSLKYIVSYGIELYGPLMPRHMKEMLWIQGKSMYYRLYQISEAKKSDEALIYHIAYFNATDTLNKLQRTRETMEIQTRYESDRKDQQINTLSLENELKESRLDQNRYFLFGSIGLLIVVLMFGYILFRQNKLKTEQQMLSLQQKLFRSQMNPHFIFNSLASIQNFMVKQDSKKASIYLSKFSELVRSILDNSTQEYIPFEKEVSTIENYLALQKVRFPDKFDYSLEV